LTTDTKPDTNPNLNTTTNPNQIFPLCTVAVIVNQDPAQLSCGDIWNDINNEQLQSC